MHHQVDGDCKKYEELLAAYADDGLVGREADEVTLHVGKCPACADEVAALRTLLVGTKAQDEHPVMPEAFWQDFARGVRVAYDEANARSWKVRLLGWLRNPAVVGAFCAAGALVLVVTYVQHREVKPQTPEVKAPVTVAKAKAKASVPVKLPVVDENDLEGAQLNAVMRSLEEEEEAGAGDATDEEMAVAGATGTSYDAVENLNEDELQRVDAKL